MKLPELAFTGALEQPEKLHSFESQELQEQYIEVLAEDACEALEQLVTSKNSRGLVHLLSNVAEKAYALVEDGASAEDAVASIVVPLRKRVQTLMNLEDYSFTNNDVHEQIGTGFETGLITDLAWLEKKLGEPLPDGLTRQIYTNDIADDRYAIDFVEAIWEINPDEGTMVLQRLDLVQNKTGIRLPAEKAAKIVEKHEDFVRNNELVMTELRAVEATYAQVVEVKQALGEKLEVYLPDAFMQVYTGDDAVALADFQAFLTEFKKTINEDAVFTQRKNSRPIKRAYIQQLALSDGALPEDELGKTLFQAFKTWKNEWLEEVGIKTERVLKTVRPVHVRSIISFANGEEMVEILR